jgi:hypothetical protein
MGWLIQPPQRITPWKFMVFSMPLCAGVMGSGTKVHTPKELVIVIFVSDSATPARNPLELNMLHVFAC